MSSLRCNLVFIVLQYVLICAAGLKTVYFSDLCPENRKTYSKTVFLGSTWKDYNSSAILKAKKFVTYPTDLSCTVTVQPPIGFGVVIAIRSTDLRSDDCSVDNLTITDSFFSRTQFCGHNYFPQEYRSTYSLSAITVVFKTGSSWAGSLFKDGFQLTATTYKTFPCSSYEYECANLRCIAKELTCDGRNHCGDGSDESRCGARSAGGIVGIVFGCVFVMIAIIAGTVYCRNRRNRRVTTTTIHCPPPQPPVPQQMHPPYGTMYPPQGPPPPQYSATLQPQEAVNPMYK